MERIVEFVNGELYHIYNRGVDKREIFLDNQDYYRYLNYLYEFNNDGPSLKNLKRRINVQGEALHMPIIHKDQIVDVLCYGLMPNHYHFIIMQLKDKGITKFMHKIGTAYAMYFNVRYKRTGRLFEAPFQAKLIETDEYLMHLSRYIHLNCLDLIESGWKEEGIKDWDRANKFLESYKWSSYLDYIGKSNFADIINKEPIKEYFKTPGEYKKYVQSWMASDMDIVEDLIIE